MKFFFFFFFFFVEELSIFNTHKEREEDFKEIDNSV